MVECSAGLIELKNAIKRELRDESDAAKRYTEMAAKFTYYGERKYSDILHLIAGQEQLHNQVLERIVDALDLECGGGRRQEVVNAINNEGEIKVK